MASETHPTERLKVSDPNSWDTAAAQYNDAVGHSSRLGAIQLISLTETLEPPLSAPSARVIDLGAGTGSLTYQLAERYPELPILATDISPSMLDQLMVNATANITTQVADMRAPVVGAAAEGSFSHVFSTMAIQLLPDPAANGTLAEWARLLIPDGIVAIGVWDFDQNCGPHALWAEAAVAVDPTYVNPPLVVPGHWNGLAQLEDGMKRAGFRDVKARSQHIGFDIGKEGFMRFFWESKNPMTLDRQASFKGDLEKVKLKMGRLLDEVYDGGRSIPLSAGLVVGRKPSEPT
ncbi:Malonyl-[acyl-carrier protein] O-methyltransferase [Lachnellula cervina]|uniref:Malonyl-[acyl-carrier protein] O-methyltransferase n=1 Tax=Lachnellula cervina TaxID=1316786 RepID=A0A7D8US52_9HELO|nr:Malonyl-[acyl-carrier protein] O-methyltransferase [Lachnellula cervina]